MQWKEDAPKCPACSAAVAKDAAECPACGVVFEKWRLKQQREAPDHVRAAPADAPPPAPHLGGGGVVKALGGGLVLAAAGVCLWLFSAGDSKPALGAVPLPEYPGISSAPPAGWEEAALSSCGGVGAGCTIRVYSRPGARKDAYQAKLSLRLFKRAKGSAAAPVGELLEGLAREIAAETGAPPPAPKEILVDGVAGYRLEARGQRHFDVETSPAVEVSATSVLQEQMRANPNQAVYSVTGRIMPNSRTGNLAVTVKAAERAIFDARPVAGFALVPARDAVLAAGWQYDEGSEAADGPGGEELVASLRVLDRPRALDRLGGLMSFLVFGAAGAAASAGLKMFLA